MKENLTPVAWREILSSGFSDLLSRASSFLPNLLGAILIVLLGWLVSRAVAAVSRRLLRRLGMDRAAARLRIDELLERASIERTFSQLLGELVFWLLMLTFLLAGVETLGLDAVSATIDQVVAFIPAVIGAALIGVLGLLLARLAGSLVSSGAAAAGFASAGRLGFLTRIVIAGLVLVVALEQLGVATEVLVLPLSVALAATGFAIGLAFALASRPVLTHILAGHFLKQSLPRDAVVEIGGRRGLVERVGAVDTLLRGEDERWSVPNARLMEEVVIR
ncbi:MAG TPA: hypothetical protein VMT85_01625 [Thermoanaerobaculia bacterium]|nr:hypothetical protein [Thermoanaerobaculia bacterium]